MGLESQELLILRVENSESGGGVIMTNDKSYVLFTFITTPLYSVPPYKIHGPSYRQCNQSRFQARLSNAMGPQRKGESAEDKLNEGG